MLVGEGVRGLAGEIEGDVIIEAYEDINALLIHLPQSPRADFAQARPALLAMILSLQFQRLGNHAVRMHVDSLHALAGDNYLPA